MTLDELNLENEALVRERLKQCCGSTNWLAGMLKLRPFAGQEDLLSACDAVWDSLTPADWLEAFAHHPKIGQQSSAKWSAEEQRGMGAASAGISQSMAQLNIDYQQRFGWIFIICATGKTAEDMLAALKSRLNNDRETELTIAAAEQSKITKLRIGKLLSE